MDGSETQPTAEALLEHAGFLRGLAGGLLRDGHAADDAVQETFAAALSRPPRAGPGLRAWLAAVTRNLALRSRRAGARRARRERVAARPEGLASAADVAARLELERRVVEALSRLEEPFRSALVQRYFDGWKPAEISARLGVPVRTVESRIRRGLERMRTELDGSCGGRGSWSLGLGLLLAMRESTRTSLASGALAAGVVLPAILAGASFAAGWTARPLLEEPAPRATATVPVRAGEEPRALKARVEELEAELASVRAAPAEAPAASDSRSPPGRRFRIDGIESALAAADWAAAAESLAGLRDLLDRMAEVVEQGGRMPLEIQAGLQRWNGPLVTFALTLSNGGVPGSGINGAFTHPAVAANLLHALLLRSGDPLDPAQESRIEALVGRCAEEDRQRRAAYGEGTPAFRKILEECELKDRFFGELLPLLGDAQRARLHSTRSRDRLVSDLWSSGCVWIQVLDRVRYTTAEGLRTRMREELAVRAGVPPSPELDALLDEWIASHPEGALGRAPDAFERGGLDSLERIREAARRQMALLDALRSRLPLAPEQLRALLSMDVLLLPYRD